MEHTSALSTARERTRQIGRRIARVEDARLLRGDGRYVADIPAPGALHAYFVRSPVAHACLWAIDAVSARSVAGVHSVWTFEDLQGLDVTTLPGGWCHPDQRMTETPLLAIDRLRWVGQPIAVVLAESAYVAEDAAELIALDVEELPAIVTTDVALEPTSPRLYDLWPDNILAEYYDGKDPGDQAFRDANIYISATFSMQRMSAAPMEGRGVLATFDPGERLLTAHISTQSAHHARETICKSTGWPEHELRVVTPDVGGGFGQKEPLYAEDVVVCVLARHVGRPVRWIEDRRENLTGSSHCRQCTWDVELAADPAGQVRALRADMVYDMGGEPTGVGIGPARIAADTLTGPYNITQCGVRIRGVVTNKTPTGAYRGYGGPESAFAIERLMDMLAARVGVDPGEIRRRNFVGPDDFPFLTPTAHNYDSGDYARALDMALDAIDYQHLAERKAEARGRGALRGVGMASFILTAGLPASQILGQIGMAHGNHETVTVRMDSSGRATVLVGATSQGQGHRTVLAQVCADVLGLDPERDIRVLQGDSQTMPYSSASAVASRVASIAGAATLQASQAMRQRLLQIAAHVSQSDPDDLSLEDGFVVGLADDKRLPLAQIAKLATTGFDLPEGMLPGLECTATFEPGAGNYPYGSHATEIEIDPRTGELTLLRYVIVNDSGTLLNPMIVEGQLIGGVVQGIGEALLESIAYDDRGQIQTASFMDYLLPTADGLPRFELLHLDHPAPGIPGGVKGVGESGTLPPPAAIANAVADALGRPDIANILPLDPPRIWSLVREALD